MIVNSTYSYLKSDSELQGALSRLGFTNEAIGEVDLASSQFSESHDVPEFLWTDIRFFSICRALSSENDDQWLVDIRRPSHSRYLEMYGVIPVVFGCDSKSGEEYHRIISKQLGKSHADAISYVWEMCIVSCRSNNWAFQFDRESERGRFYCKPSVDLPEELRAFIE